MDQRTFNRLYRAYLEHSIRYYELEQPIVSDHLFDQLCRALLRHWHGFDHRFKHLTDESALAAGTGFHLAGLTVLRRVRWMIVEPPYNQSLMQKFSTDDTDQPLA